MNYRIGLDIGIGSVGWSVISHDVSGDPMRIVGCGCRTFVPAENPKDGTSLAVDRRNARHSRRTLRRRNLRLKTLKAILKKELFNGEIDFNTFLGDGTDIFMLRYTALDKKVSKQDFSRILVNIFKHRGFKSTRKSELKEKDAGSLLKAISQNEKLIKENNYRTVGEMIYLNKNFHNTVSNTKKENIDIYMVRNSSGNYEKSFSRRELENEINEIFSAQRKLGSSWASKELEQKIIELFSRQRSFDEGPGEGSKYKASFAVGKCTFEEGEKRASKGSRTFEIFQCLQNFNNCKITSLIDGDRFLTKEEKDKIYEKFLSTSKLTFKQVRKLIDLKDYQRFNLVSYDSKRKSNIKNNVEQKETKEKDPEDKVFVSKEKSALVEKSLSLNSKFNELNNDEKISCIDDCAQMVTIAKSDANRMNFVLTNSSFEKWQFLRDEAEKFKLIDEKELSEEEKIALYPKCFSELLEVDFSKVCNLSTKAMKKMIPFLKEGQKYDKAATSAGYKFNEQEQNLQDKISAKEIFEDIDSITSPVAKRAVSQTIKVVNALVNKYGTPDSIFVELAREVSKTFDERRKITQSQNENMISNEKIYTQLKSFGLTNPKGQDIQKLKLYYSQGGKCAYSQKSLLEVFGNMASILSNNNTQIDHIIPYSKCYDDSMSNKVLVCADENQNKGQRTPFEYFGQDQERWEKFEMFVESQFGKSKKARNLLKMGVSDEEAEELNSRALNDTKFATSFVQNMLKNNLKFADSKFSKVPVRAVNGSITSFLRKIWGLSKDRVENDKHHAQDAIVIATATNNVLQKVTKYLQFRSNKKIEKHDGMLVDLQTGEIIPLIPEPYTGFVSEIKAILSSNPQLYAKDLQWAGYDNEEISKIKPIFVSRMPTRKIKGPIHDSTIRSVALNQKTNKGLTIVLTKTPIQNLKLDENGDIKDYPQKFIESDKLLYEKLVARLKLFKGDGKLAFKEPLFKPNPKGGNSPVVKTVKLQKAINDFVEIKTGEGKGIAEKSNIVRTDVFEKNGKNYLVPIYVSDVYSGILPNRAITQGKPFSEWKEMDETYHFKFSLFPNDLIFIKNKKEMPATKEITNVVIGEDGKEKALKQKINGFVNNSYFYYSSCDSSTASIAIFTHDREWSLRIGVQSLDIFEKYQVDILGNVSKAEFEPRQEISLKNSFVTDYEKIGE
ncbi:MAG: type II CRISPR RNA-guided endonuclease Cas9 [Clostridia bacterium]